MLDMRMLFSTLVDADFIETEAWFGGDVSGVPCHRKAAPCLNAPAAYALLTRYIEDTVRTTSTAATHVNDIRNILLNDCLHKAETTPGLFTLTAPTGAGKTLAMLAFALKHACHNPRIRRIIMVIPYLSIIEQTADRYREIFDPAFGPLYVVEHHSLAGLPAEENDADKGEKADTEDDAAINTRLLADNWDAPIIITTSVQCLESMFANRPRACRKLHRMVDSVILFDEVQTLPPPLAVPTLAALSHLSSRYGSTIVFATATQPAFTGLHDKVREFTAAGWMPTEIVTDTASMFSMATRTKINWHIGPAKKWNDIADELADEPNRQVLCIVNTKRHAAELACLLKGAVTEGLFHLSTSMCPAHRRAKLKEIRTRLETGMPCRLISTQCVEAGVDVDFPVVYRAFGPLDSIAQAAGRCNRSGKLSGLAPVHIFVPEDSRLYPKGAYEQAASVAEALLKSSGELDIHDPETFRRYYTTLYEITGNTDISDEFATALAAWHFPLVAEKYRLIPGVGINVLVPYDRSAYSKLLEDVQAMPYITSEWTRKARDHTVSVCCRKHDVMYRYLTPIKTIRGGESDEWFFCEYYDKDLLGLRVEAAGHGLYA
jgi:CRISPR-associated helicase Cas3